MISQKTTTSPTLNGSGAFTVAFGKAQKVNSCGVKFDNPFTSKYLFCLATSITGNVITITVMKMTMDSVGAWVVAVTADLNAKTVNVIADCE